jgi:predicted TIM-barrel fold metal-dependent hydrolase
MRIIDIDGHVREADDLWERYLEPPFRARAPKVQRVPNGQLLFLLEGTRYHRKPDESPFETKRNHSPANPHRERGMDPTARLNDMDVEGIEAGMLFPSAGLYLPSVEEEPYAVALCRAYNNWLFDYCRTNPRRLLGVGVIPFRMSRQRWRKPVESYRS